MVIYTKAGDSGYASDSAGRRARKDDWSFRATGAIDELNCFIGSCSRAALDAGADEVHQAMAPLQSELMAVGAIVSSGQESVGGAFDANAVERMEKQIDAAWAKMPELTHFILPGGSELSCRLHVARAMCRRTERELVAAVSGGMEIPPVVLKYLNRMSDLLFTMGRLANYVCGEKEIIWPD